DLASELGIKSASLHYHFPKKADLGEAMVQRYADRFFDRLYGATHQTSHPETRLGAFLSEYRSALGSDNRVCLCVMLGAESPGLPKQVTHAVQDFLNRNIEWLEAVYANAETPQPSQKAQTTLASIQGAMILSSISQNKESFDSVSKAALNGLSQHSEQAQ
ncbi:MAG: TetR/AcrR family transcriptional regulator, partial [Pseudomonadota bacterium]